MDKNMKIALVIVACLAIALGSTVIFAMPIPKDINDLGTLRVWTSVDMTEISEGETITQDDGLRVTLTSTWAGLPTATLKVAGKSVENSEGTRVSEDMTVWIFTLDSIPAGTNDAYVFFSGMYSPDQELVGHTHGFKVYSDTPPVYDPPVITVKPTDVNVSVGETVKVTWWYKYAGPASIVVTLDGDTVRDIVNTLTIEEQVISSTRIYNVTGTYELVLTITPDSGIDVTSDSVMVTVEEVDFVTTTTTTEITPTTGTVITTTPTDEGEPESYDYTYPLLFGAGAVMILIIILIRRRS